MNLCDFAQSLPERLFRSVLEASVLDEEAEVPIAVMALGPIVAVRGGGESVVAFRLELPPEALVEFGGEPADATVLNGVFKACMASIGSVAVVALDLDQVRGRAASGADRLGKS